MELDRCTDTPDREIIHGSVGPDTCFISLPLFCVSFGVCVSVCVTIFLRAHNKEQSQSQSCPNTTSRFITSTHSLSKITLPRTESSHSRQHVTQILPLRLRLPHSYSLEYTHRHTCPNKPADIPAPASQPASQ